MAASAKFVELRKIVTRTKTAAIRVLHCPTMVGGNPQGLAQAERSLGLDSWAVSFERHPFGYACDEVLWSDSSAIVRNELLRWRLLWRALRNFDVVHFNFGTPILPKRLDLTPLRSSRAKGLLRKAYNAYATLVEFKDLSMLRRLKKAIFVTYQGYDARQADYCLANFAINPAAEADAEYYPLASDERKRREIACFERHANGIFAVNPDLLHVLPSRARFVPYAHIDPRTWLPVAKAPSVERPLVVHAPSHPKAKGTRFVLDAVSRLRSEGMPFDFRLVEGLSHSEARKVYEQADLAIDQLLSGWYGGLAVELMALSKPVICYLREQDLNFLDPEMRRQLPLIHAEPGTIYDVLKDCLTLRRAQLSEIGARSRAYVEKWHDPISIAARLKDDYISALQRIHSASA